MCLLKVIDRTVTAMGGRMLSDRLSSPIMDIKEINDRLDMISFFIEHNKIRKEIRNQLRKCQDLKRSIQRLSLNRGGPRDLYDLATTLHLIPYIKVFSISFHDLIVHVFLTQTVFHCLDIPLYPVNSKAKFLTFMN